MLEKTILYQVSTSAENYFIPIRANNKTYFDTLTVIFNFLGREVLRESIGFIAV